ncbi:MAG: radical SAM family heme chaperone HemW [Hyphomonadaceae bacterium]|nr:radical SAM family heme chaperone HemW [Hyphomonadaceae bacterium]
MTGFNTSSGFGRGFGVYLHWPYCARVCPYCDFNVYAAKARDTAPLFDAILKDLDGWRARSGERSVDTVFFGGGTPSLMTGSQVTQALEKIDMLWGIKSGAEVTLEANPDDHACFADFAAAGVNRLSLGVQSLDGAPLKFLGRTHSAADAIAAFRQTQGKFRSVSLDLIYALPGQTLDQWRAELARTLALGPDHLSLYELSIEPGAAFAKAVQRRDWAPMDDELCADLYELTQEMADKAGYPAYEISNHARGPAHESAHNRIYWASGDWAGVGPGAHGRLTIGDQRIATHAEDNPGAYLKQVDASGVGWAEDEMLNALAQARERVAMGLRVKEGLALRDISELGFQPDVSRIAEFESLGLLTHANGRIVLTVKGRLAADRIAAELAP